MPRTKYRKTRGRKPRGKKTMRNKKHIKKQYGGQISDDCIKEIIREAVRQNAILSAEQVNVILNKFMSVSTLWRDYRDLMDLLVQIGEMTEQNLNYDETLNWTTNIVDHLIRSQDIN